MTQILKLKTYTGQEFMYVIPDEKISAFLETLKKDHDYCIIPVESGAVYLMRKTNIEDMGFLSQDEVDVVLKEDAKPKVPMPDLSSYTTIMPPLNLGTNLNTYAPPQPQLMRMSRVLATVTV